jgi:hypothetical protein
VLYYVQEDFTMHVLRELYMFIGFAAVIAGVALIYVPAALIIGGLWLVYVGVPPVVSPKKQGGE